MAVAALAVFGVWFLVIFVLRTILQKRRTGDSGLRTGGLSSAPGSVEWVAAWLLVAALIAAVAAPVAALGGLDPLATNRWLQGAGAVLAVVGIVCTFVAQLDMGEQWRVGLDPDETTGLVTEGTFAVVRNPIFSTMLLTGFGLALMVPNVVAVAGFVALVAAIELQVRGVEEPHLRRLHGPAYAEYARRVGRLVPGIGRCS